MKTRRIFLPKNKGLRTVVGLFLIVIVLLSMLPLFISLDRFRPEIEVLLSEAIEQPVQIGRLSMQLIPFPRLSAHNVLVGAASQPSLQIQRLDAYPRLHALLDREVDIRHIRGHQVVVGVDFINRMIDLAAAAPSEAEPSVVLKIAKITVSEVIVRQGITTFGPYAGQVKLTDTLDLLTAAVVREDNVARLEVLPVAEGFSFSLQAKAWQLPIAPNWLFDSLTGHALLKQNQLSVSSLQAKMYQGELQGKAELSWQKDWQIKGSIETSQLSIEPFLKPLLDKPVVSGRLTGNGSYVLQATKASELGEQPTVNAELKLLDGVIYNADLEKATNILSGDVKGGQTPFTQLSTLLSMHEGNITLKNMLLKSKSLDADGALNIDDKQALNGEIEVGVSSTGSLVSMPIKISGSLDEPALRPTDAAIVGGAVGTGLLGPGFGTAVGVKASKVIDGIGSFLTQSISAIEVEDSDENEDSFASDDSE